MEKGKRYAQSTRGSWVMDSSGHWLYDPDKELEKRNLKLLADLETYEIKVGRIEDQIMKDITKIDFLEKQVTDLDAALQEKKKTIHLLERHNADMVERTRKLGPGGRD